MIAFNVRKIHSKKCYLLMMWVDKTMFSVLWLMSTSEDNKVYMVVITIAELL